MYMNPIVELDILKIIDKFNQNKSAGNDNIGNFIIKRVAEAIENLLQGYSTYLSEPEPVLTS